MNVLIYWKSQRAEACKSYSEVIREEINDGFNYNLYECFDVFDEIILKDNLLQIRQQLFPMTI